MAKQPPYPPQVASDQPPAAPREYPIVQQQAPAAPPQPSHLRKATPHHSSPTPGDKQTPFPKPPEKNVPRKIGRMPDVPMHVTKHPNPVGRPKKPRG